MIDLEAYRAPAAPAGLADRVIARVHAADEAIAASAATRSRQRRRWIFGAGAAVVVAAGVLAWEPWERAAAPRNSLVAKLPGRVELEGVIGNADPGAELEWQRGDQASHVAQRAGSVTWSVAANHHLSVDVGAAVASIEATNATFRVETRMNLSDVRTVGITAVTAASVALVSVVVYEGHVKVSGAGQTVIVNPGTAMTVAPGKPPVALTNIGGGPLVPVPATKDASAEVWIAPGESAVIHDVSGPTLVGIATRCASSASVSWVTPDPLHPTMIETTSLTAPLAPGASTYQVFCDGGSAVAAHGSITVVRAGQDVIAIDKVQQSSFDRQAWPAQWQLEGTAEANVQLSASGIPIEVTADGHFRVLLSEPQTLPPLVVRAEHPTRGTHYYVTRPHADVTVQKPDPADADEIAQQQKLADYRMIALTPRLRACVNKQTKGHVIRFRLELDGTVADLSTSYTDAAVNGCLIKLLAEQFTRARYPAKAIRTIEFKFSEPKPPVAPVVPAACDADALKNKGADAESSGEHRRALKFYDQALTCKPEPHVLQLAFMSACNGLLLPEARRYWKRLEPRVQERLLSIALRAHFTRAELDAP